MTTSFDVFFVRIHDVPCPEKTTKKSKSDILSEIPDDFKHPFLNLPGPCDILKG
jgi:hypothetical protein